jgi:hypothetical protein
VARILAKLQLRDRAQVVVVAYETGLITPGESSQQHGSQRDGGPAASE